MSTIQTINSGDQITNSRADINTNFANLNADKFEKSDIDTDTSMAANSDTKVPSQKAVKAYIDTGGNPFSVETTSGTTHSLTTTASQRVVVWASGIINNNGGTTPTVSLQYNGVTKHSVTTTIDNRITFALMYTEVPGAATNDITVSTSAGTVTSVVILVFKINV